MEGATASSSIAMAADSSHGTLFAIFILHFCFLCSNYFWVFIHHGL